MSRLKLIGAIALIVVSVTSMIWILESNAAKERRERQKREANQARVINNAMLALKGADKSLGGTDLSLFFTSLKAEPSPKITANADGTYTVSFPSFVVTEKQLVEYADSHVEWIDEGVPTTFPYPLRTNQP